MYDFDNLASKKSNERKLDIYNQPTDVVTYESLNFSAAIEVISNSILYIMTIFLCCGFKKSSFSTQGYVLTFLTYWVYIM